jgi:hypothetical protein
MVISESQNRQWTSDSFITWWQVAKHTNKPGSIAYRRHNACFYFEEEPQPKEAWMHFKRQEVASGNHSMGVLSTRRAA